ncbi:RING-type domain-containing protein [Meloidogyne graminicola]|uniref:RING-type domain-containing protein n=1 Tax=Meloidogyne graminicola TaxID=189291 RepID=A0A8S9ZTP7_9BILA|nr:RING-type domain-containing protein [Meloidogyne graminicola]
MLRPILLFFLLDTVWGVSWWWWSSVIFLFSTKSSTQTTNRQQQSRLFPPPFLYIYILLCVFQVHIPSFSLFNFNFFLFICHFYLFVVFFCFKKKFKKLTFKMFIGLINAVRRKIHNLNEEKENNNNNDSSTIYEYEKHRKCQLLGQQGTSQQKENFDLKKTKLPTLKTIETSKRKSSRQNKENKNNNNIVAMENNYNCNGRRSNNVGGGTTRVTTMERIEKLKQRFQQESTEDEMDNNTQDEFSERCCICLSQRASVQTYPCTHQVFCRLCALTLIQTLYKSGSEEMRCVICRANIVALRHQKEIQRVTTTNINPLKNEMVTHWRCSYNRKRVYND